MRAPEVLETDRLLLRRPRASDAHAIFERYASDPEVTRYLSFPCHTSAAQTEGFIDFSDVEWSRWPAGPFLIESLGDHTLLGGTGFSFETPTRASNG